MRVLLVMDPFITVPPRHYGGIERVIADLADGLKERGHDGGATWEHQRVLATALETGNVAAIIPMPASLMTEGSIHWSARASESPLSAMTS